MSQKASAYVRGSQFNEGKTKILFNVVDEPDLTDVLSKKDITAGDGAKHDIILDKGRLANETTCNNFRLLQACDVPVAFVAKSGVDSFIGRKCTMLPYEVVVRREAHGSFLKRSPHIKKGHLFPKLVVEFFLKTKDRDWAGARLVCDDPLMRHDPQSGKVLLFDPAKPINGQEPFLVLNESSVFGVPDEAKYFPEMNRLATKAFLVLEKAWQLEGRKLVDFKVEFGLTSFGHLLLADVVDNDSWRVVEDGLYIDKQVYRDGGALDDVAAKYRHVAEITGRFGLPRQRIILWRGSDSDKIETFIKAFGEFADLVETVTCSVHKKPQESIDTFLYLTRQVPDSVCIAFVGMSNGAGPTLSAMSTVPVITVPATIDNFADDVWSSLRGPSEVPVMTVLKPANAVLAALQILSARNPRIYAHLQGKIEERLVNTMRL